MFNHNTAEDYAPAFVALVAEEAFRICRNLANSNCSSSEWQTFVSCVQEAYDAEVATLELNLGNVVDKANALLALWHKSVLPVVMMGHVVMLCPDRRASVDPFAVKELMELAGSLVGEIDDAVDVPADLDAGRWSFILLEMSNLSGQEMIELGTAGCISEFIRRKLAKQIAARVALGLDRVARLSGEVTLAPDRFIENCQYWLSGWFVSNCVSESEGDQTNGG